MVDERSEGGTRLAGWLAGRSKREERVASIDGRIAWWLIFDERQ